MKRPRKPRSMHVRLAEGVDLYLGDCLKIIPGQGLEARHCLCDPPYEERMHKARAGKLKRRDGYKASGALRFDPIGEMREQLLPLIGEACTGWFLAFCTPEGIAAWRDAIERHGLRYKRACFWDKVDAAPQFNGQGPGYGVEPFVTAWCGAGVSRWNGGGRKNLFSHPTNPADRRERRRVARSKDDLHETEKPVALMAELVRLFTNPGEKIIDPFMGSGSTGVAAVRAGRPFVGIEKDPAYFKIAEARIRAALAQPDMFVPIPQLKVVRLPL